MNCSARTIVFIALVFGWARGQDEGTGKRGLYFLKKNLTEVSIPSFIESRSKLPSPILENNHDYVEFYWKAGLLAFDHFQTFLRA